MQLRDKVATVTGGAQGIGRAIALRLARDGANIGILDIKKAVADRTAEEIIQLGVKALVIECDVTNYEKVCSEMGNIWHHIRFFAGCSVAFCIRMVR